MDDLTLHLVELADAKLIALSPLGEIYIAQLQLNRPALIEHRAERRMMSRIETHLVDMTVALNKILSAIKGRQT